MLRYAECKQPALDKVKSFAPPAIGHDMRMYHSLYLTNLLALLDVALELFGEMLDTAGKKHCMDWVAILGKTTPRIFEHFEAIHRGVDITAAGTVLAGQVCAIE